MTNWKKPGVQDVKFWFEFLKTLISEIKLQIKRTKVSLKLPLINFKCRCRMHFTYQRGNKWDMWGLRSPLFLPKINKIFFYFPGLTTFMVCTWKLEPSCCKKCQKKFQPRNWFKEYGTSEGSEWYQMDSKLSKGNL